MIVIETENGRFEGETEREALRLARKARRESAKREHLAAIARKRAYDRARCEGFNILARKLSGQGFPRGWRFIPAGDPHCPTIERRGESLRRIVIETEDGRGELEFYKIEILGIVENGAGWAMGVFVVNDGKTELWSVGADGSATAIAHCPGILPSEFNIGGANRNEWSAA